MNKIYLWMHIKIFSLILNLEVNHRKHGKYGRKYTCEQFFQVFRGYRILSGLSVSN